MNARRFDHCWALASSDTPSPAPSPGAQSPLFRSPSLLSQLGGQLPTWSGSAVLVRLLATVPCRAFVGLVLERHPRVVLRGIAKCRAGLERGAQRTDCGLLLTPAHGSKPVGY